MFLVSFFSAAIIATFSFLKGSDKNIIVLALILVLGLFAGTRVFGVDPDYEVYYSIFVYTTSSDFAFSDFAFFEPFSYVIPFVNKLLFGNYYVESSILMFAFVGVSLKLISLKKADCFFLSLALYCSYCFFYQEMITIRVGVACGIFMLALPDLIDKKDRTYFLKIVCALLFHYSSVIFIVVWCVVRLKVSLKYFYVLLLSSFYIAVFKVNVLTLFMIDAIFPKVKLYLDVLEVEGGEAVNVFSFRTLIAIFFLFLFMFKIKTVKHRESFVVLFKIHIISLCFFFALSPTANVFSLRIFDMLSVVQIFLFPLVVYVFKEKFIGHLIIFLVCAVNLYYIFGISDLFNKYESWLF